MKYQRQHAKKTLRFKAFVVVSFTQRAIDVNKMQSCTDEKEKEKEKNRIRCQICNFPKNFNCENIF